MAEVRKIVCDMCGDTINNGYEIATSYRRRIVMKYPLRGQARFGLCDKCFNLIFNLIKEACEAKEGGAKK